MSKIGLEIHEDYLQCAPQLFRWEDITTANLEGHGLYGIFSPGEPPTLYYLGKTSQLEARFHTHHRSHQIDRLIAQGCEVFVWVALGEEFANREKQAIADLSPLLNQQKTVQHQKLNLGIPESLLESHLSRCRDGEYTLFRLAPQSPAFEFGFDSVPIQQLSGFDNYCSYELYKSTSCIPDFPPPPPEYKPCYGILHTEMLSWLLVVAERSPLLDHSCESESLLEYDFEFPVEIDGAKLYPDRDQTMLAIGYDNLVTPANKENPTEWVWDITLKQPHHGAVQAMPRFVHSILANEFACYVCPEEPTDEEREAWVKGDTGLTLSQYETVARAVWHQRDRSPYVIGRKSLQPLL